MIMETFFYADTHGKECDPRVERVLAPNRTKITTEATSDNRDESVSIVPSNLGVADSTQTSNGPRIKIANGKCIPLKWGCLDD